MGRFQERSMAQRSEPCLKEAPMSEQTSGTVFNIQHYSVHDGPGIRTLIFLKGCPLRCLWCSNPESQTRLPQLAYNATKCVSCARCVTACPQKALEMREDGIHIDRKLCPPSCRICSETCPGQVLTHYGKPMTVKEVLDKVEADEPFYARSGGGLTLSGGEPLMQAEFTLAILEAAEHRAIHTAMESCGQADEETILAICAKLDYLLFDIKHLDSDAHKKATGVGNECILRNLEAVRSAYPRLPIHLRTPIIPGINDDENLIRRILSLAQSLDAVNYEILPYHRMGEQKYHYLGRQYLYEGPEQVDPQKLERLQSLVVSVYPNALATQKG